LFNNVANPARDGEGWWLFGVKSTISF